MRATTWAVPPRARRLYRGRVGRCRRAARSRARVPRLASPGNFRVVARDVHASRRASRARLRASATSRARPRARRRNRRAASTASSRPTSPTPWTRPVGPRGSSRVVMPANASPPLPLHPPFSRSRRRRRSVPDERPFRSPGIPRRSSPLCSSLSPLGPTPTTPPPGRDPAPVSSLSTPGTFTGMSPAGTRRPRSTRPRLNSSPRRCRRRRKAGSAAKVPRRSCRSGSRGDSPTHGVPISRRLRTRSETDGRGAFARRSHPWRRRSRGPGATPRTSSEERWSSEKNSTEDSDDASRPRVREPTNERA